MFVLLHGGSGCTVEMEPVAQALAPQFPSRSVNLLGHGGRPVPDEFSFDAFVADLAETLEKMQQPPIYLLGYSFGGLVALGLAARRPDLVRGVVGLAIKYVYDTSTVGHIRHIGNPERLRLVGSKIERQERYHGSDKWENLLVKNVAMFESFLASPPLTDEVLASIETPVLLVSGSRDQVVPAAEVTEMFDVLPNAVFSFFAGPAHPIEAVPMSSLKRMVGVFCRSIDEGRFGELRAQVKERRALAS